MTRYFSYLSSGLPLGTFLIATLAPLASIQAADNPFQSKSLLPPYIKGVTQADKPGDCPMTKEDREANKKMRAEGKCGEGKCGAVNLKEAKCGEGKCGVENRIKEGRCKAQ